jgi:hypothetical protein
VLLKSDVIYTQQLCNENYKDIISSSVRIRLFDKKGYHSGSGICISETKENKKWTYLIITAAHVMVKEPPTRELFDLLVPLIPIEEQTITYEISAFQRDAKGFILKTLNISLNQKMPVVVDEVMDLAIITIKSNKQLPLIPASILKNTDYDKQYIGQPLFSVSCPYGAIPVIITNGNLVAKKRTVKKHVFDYANILLSPGSSGGGVFDESAKLTGIFSMMRTSEVPYLAYYVSSKTIRQFIKENLKHLKPLWKGY